MAQYMKRSILLLFVTCVVAIFLGSVAAQSDGKGGQTQLQDGLYAILTTNRGVVYIALEFEKTPLTVANFAGLASGIVKNASRGEGVPFYNGLIFHRVVPGFVVQSGDPTGTGSGGPGYAFEDEFVPELTHNKAGVVSMANAGPATNGSQFFITLNNVEYLNNKHSVFGHVARGMDIVESIRQGDTIRSIEIVAAGEKARIFMKPDNPYFGKLNAKYEETQDNARKEMAADREKMTKDLAQIRERYPNYIASKSGVLYLKQKEGAGQPPVLGTKVSIRYTCTLLNGTFIDGNLQRREPFSFVVGKSEVAAGLDESVLSMKKGEKRIAIIPPELGYGKKGGAGGIIPANAWLIFDVELIDY